MYLEVVRDAEDFRDRWPLNMLIECWHCHSEYRITLEDKRCGFWRQLWGRLPHGQYYKYSYNDDFCYGDKVKTRCPVCHEINDDWRGNGGYRRHF